MFKSILTSVLFLAFSTITYAQQDSVEVIEDGDLVDFEIEEEIEEEQIFMVVETVPEFPGGQAALYKYIGKNLKYPKEARDKGIQGKVIVSFVVDKTGDITDAKIIRDIGAGCGEEALRVVNSMPRWKPGVQRGKPVKVRFMLPFNFSMK